jgi:hypothetical protein
MKFWKVSLLTTVLFFALGITVLYTACEKDACNNVTCYNGGSCGNGYCHCPTGYENTQCQDKAVTRYLGVYAGYITCNNGAEVIDTAFIYADSTNANTINYVWIKWKSELPTILHGYVYFNESVYSIVVPNVVADNYLKIYTITLQNWGNQENNKLSIQSYSKSTVTPGDTVQTQCQFIGFKPS